MLRHSVGGVVMTIVLAMTGAVPAGAQTPTSRPAATNSSGEPGDSLVPTGPLVPPTAMDARAAAVQQTGSMSWRPVVFAGFATTGGGVGYGGGGLSIGGGVVASNVADREEFGLQIDAAYTNYGDFGCDFCDVNARSLAFSGAFLYLFEELEGGWQPFTGGGIVIVNLTWDVGSFTDVDGTFAGIQVQGGINRNLDNGTAFGFEGRVQSTIGGAFLLLARYRF